MQRPVPHVFSPHMYLCSLWVGTPAEASSGGLKFSLPNRHGSQHCGDVAPGLFRHRMSRLCAGRQERQAVAHWNAGPRRDLKRFKSDCDPASPNNTSRSINNKQIKICLVIHTLPKDVPASSRSAPFQELIHKCRANKLPRTPTGQVVTEGLLSAGHSAGRRARSVTALPRESRGSTSPAVRSPVGELRPERSSSTIWGHAAAGKCVGLRQALRGLQLRRGICPLLGVCNLVAISPRALATRNLGKFKDKAKHCILPADPNKSSRPRGMNEAEGLERGLQRRTKAFCLAQGINHRGSRLYLRRWFYWLNQESWCPSCRHVMWL